jgi:pyruvate/2-oxoglutarate dehydrogenase complex dihydrolipoamide acyltransferase (E2) component
VVRREAQIGGHSFLLKEIYGLSTSSNSTDTSYPPTSSDPYASTPNECIVCLTSPRDVVLLPCRHLVVCRECAVGMVEFGAGGRVARRDDAEAAEPAPDATDAATADGTAAPAPAPAPAAPAPTRRKKKAKGWYCPVCRQRECPLQFLTDSYSLHISTPPGTGSHQAQHAVARPIPAFRSHDKVTGANVARWCRGHARQPRAPACQRGRRRG